MKFTTAAGLGVAVAVAGALVYVVRKAGITSNSFNPASDQNLAYQGVNAIVQAITGDKNQTFGGLIYDKANPRAGLADNEYSPAPGIIVTRPIASTMPASAGWDVDVMNGLAAYSGFVDNEGGAAVGRTVSRGF